MNGKKLISSLLVLVMLVCLCGCSGSGSAKTEKKNGYKIAVVPKTISTGWFQRMEEGVKAYNEEHGTNYFFGGPTDVTDQVTYLEQLLAEDWDAICIVPYDIESIAPLMEKARKEGIVVIAHEADAMDSKYFDYDIEPFLPEDLGTHYGELIVEKTGGTGTYVQFVGSLNSVSHIRWCDAADAYIAANSDMVKLGRYESNEDPVMAYNQTKELLQAHPEIVAIECSSSVEPAGVAQAVEELGLSGKIVIVGTSLPSSCGEYVTDGTLATISLWDPEMSGRAMLAMAEQVLEQKDNFDVNTCSLPVAGYEKLIVKGNVLYGSARADITKENIGDYPF